MNSLNFLDKFLTVWIFLSMLLGVLLGYYVPDVAVKLSSIKFAEVSLPMCIGLIWMMYPILCKVRYESLNTTLKSKETWKHIALSLIINWIISPLVMVVLGWVTLFDLVEYRSGLILVGTARCIAMVLVWNRLAGGDEELCAIIVAFNSLLQVLLYGPLSYVLVIIFSKGSPMGINMWPVVQSVLVFLGIPLFLSIITRYIFIKINRKFFENTFLPVIGPTSLLALLFVIVVMFASQGHDIIINIKTVFRVVVPRVIYFVLMFFSVLAFCYYFCIPYKIMSVQSFTAASNNFELAIAVASSVYGETSKEAMAATIGPLVEVPILLLFVYILKYIKKKWYDPKTEQCGCKDD
jgi:arsenical-resistance protein